MFTATSEPVDFNICYEARLYVFVSLLDSSTTDTKPNSYTCSKMHLSLPFTLSLSKYHTTPLVTLHFPLKPAGCRGFQTDREGGSCLGFLHYVIQCNTCCHCPLSVSNTPRGDFHFSLSFCAPWPLRLVTTQAETDPLQPHTPCVCLCVCWNYPYHFTLQNTPFLKLGTFTWGSHCKQEEGGDRNPHELYLTV